MRFYTNVQMVGDNFLVRGYEDGKHFVTREKFYPTLFVDSKVKTKYKTLNEEYVEPISPGTVRECREFVKKYSEVENFNIYGNERYIYQYISDKYPEVEVKFDIEKIKLATIDIEVASENGFPDVGFINGHFDIVAILITDLLFRSEYSFPGGCHEFSAVQRMAGTAALEGVKLFAGGRQFRLTGGLRSFFGNSVSSF